MKNAVFWDIKAEFVPHRGHYVSATEPNRLMLCKIWGFHGGGYEECRLLGSHRVAFVWVEVSEERIASVIRLTRIVELATTLAVTTKLKTLRRNIANVVPSSPMLVSLIMETILSSEISVLTRATRHHVAETTFFNSSTELCRQSCIAPSPSPTWNPGRSICVTPWQGVPVSPPDTGFPFCRLLRLAGLRLCFHEGRPVIYFGANYLQLIQHRYKDPTKVSYSYVSFNFFIYWAHSLLISS
jgi:hypothetical protein